MFSGFKLFHLAFATSIIKTQNPHIQQWVFISRQSSGWVGLLELHAILLMHVLTVVICPDVGIIENGAKSSSNVTFGSVVSLTCNTGYRFSDGSAASSILCTAPGTWSAAPTCEGYCPVFCVIVVVSLI